MLEKLFSASAGTGKTQTIIEKTFEIIKDDPSKIKRIVFLTFSNAATQEIKTRFHREMKKTKSFYKNAKIDEKLEILNYIRAYTFHSFCYEIVKIFRYRYPLPSEINFSYQQEDRSKIWEETVDNFFRKSWNLSCLTKISENENLAKALYLISERKNLKEFIKTNGQMIYFMADLDIINLPEDSNLTDEKLKTIEQYSEQIQLTDSKDDSYSKILNKLISTLFENEKCIFDLTLIKIIQEIGEEYKRNSFLKNSFDYNIFVYLVAKLLKEIKLEKFMKILEEEDFGFDYIFIDEAQDCDVIMNYILSYFWDIRNNNHKIIMVGDAKQSIYRWRNAYPEEFKIATKEAEQNKEYLNISQRIENKNTVKIINSLMENVLNSIKTNFPNIEKEFPYNKDNDELKFNEREEKEAKFFYTSQKPPYIPNFLNEGKTGILIRKRRDLYKSKLDSILPLNTLYRISDTFEEETPYESSSSQFSEEEIIDITPDYYLLKFIIQILDPLVPKNNLLFFIFTEKGNKIISQIFSGNINISQNPSANDLIEYISDINEEISKITTSYTEALFSEKIYKFLYEKNIWKFFQRNESSVDFLKTIRYFHSALTQIYLSEISKTDVTPLETIASSKIPFDSAHLLESNTSEPYFEVTTIHSSKGLTYDHLIIITDFANLLSLPQNINYFLYYISFPPNVMTPNIKVNLNFFPYIKFKKEVINKIENKNLENLYKKIIERELVENISLFYVAITRTRKSLYFVTLDKTKKQSIDLEEILIQLNFTYPENDIRHQNTQISNQTQNLITLLKPQKNFKIIPVRKYIQSSELQEKGENQNNLSSIFTSAITGIEVHRILSELFKNEISSENDFKSLLSEFEKSKNRYTNTAAKIILENIQTLFNIFKILGKKLTELPVWGLENDNVLKGIIDLLVLNDKEINIFEFKTLFSSSKSQEELALKQLEIYSSLISKTTTKKYKIIKQTVKIDAKKNC